MDKIYILDASGYIFRSYFAIRNITNAKGESTNALFGFIRSILRLIKDFDPKYLVAVFDGPDNAKKREAIYPKYKAHRMAAPSDLLYQIPWAQEFCDLLGIPQLNIPEVEADDTMASVAKWAEGLGATIYLCTSDKDLCQVVDDKILILNTHKDNKVLGPKEVEETYGVSPQQMIDFLAIVGDSSDNIPGLSGFGPKTAAELLKQFGTLEKILTHPQDVPGKKKQETISREAEQAHISKKLVTIDTGVPFPKKPEFFLLKKTDLPKLKEFYAKMNFNSLLRELGEDTPEGGTSKGRSQDKEEYILVDNEKAFKELLELLKQQKQVCFDTETTQAHPLRADLVGIGFGFEEKRAWYIPANGKLGLEAILKSLKPLFESSSIGFYGHNVKYDYQVLANYGVKVANLCFDTILASYLLNSHSRQHSLDYLSLEYFGKVKTPIQSLIGKGKAQISMKDVPIEKVCSYCCEDVDYTCRLKNALEKELKERNLVHLLSDIELPLLPILAHMERHGMYLDIARLRQMSKEITAQIRELEEEVYRLAGEKFNINSPKQLSHILFTKMQIKPPKKTATGFSTNAEVLENLKQHYPIAGKVLEYRTLEKLRSTYLDALPLEVNSNTHRIHCNFNQSVAATGRLASQDPNLQNIPVRSEVGRKIRSAFRPEKEDWSFLSADYSQIELRILAHMSEDPTLISAFQENQDIHTHTAATIFGIPLDKVSPAQRYQAKAVNFGVIYGQQAFGLAQELGIEVKDAATFIEMYFQRYQRIKEFVKECKEKARKTGKAVTMTGRERLLPEIRSQNAMLRSAAERLAINTPLQGTAADLIKLAMIQLDEVLAQQKKETFLILQIHDELLFEVPDSELSEVNPLIRDAMQGVWQLKVPLIVDISVGKNWEEC